MAGAGEKQFYPEDVTGDKKYWKEHEKKEKKRVKTTKAFNLKTEALETVEWPHNPDTHSRNLNKLKPKQYKIWKAGRLDDPEHRKQMRKEISEYPTRTKRDVKDLEEWEEKQKKKK